MFLSLGKWDTSLLGTQFLGPNGVANTEVGKWAAAEPTTKGLRAPYVVVSHTLVDTERGKIPKVIIDREVESINTDSVLIDNLCGGYKATKHILDQVRGV